MDWLLFRLTTAGISATCCFSLGWLAYYKNKHSKINQNFALFNLFLGLWNIGDISIALSSAQNALFFDRLSYIWGTLVAPPFFFLCCEISGKNEISRGLKTAVTGLAIFLLAIAFTPWLIHDVKITPYFQEQPGPLYPVFIFYFLFLVGYGVSKVFKGYRDAIGIRRNQLKYIFVAFFVGFWAAITYFWAMTDPHAPPLCYALETCYTLIVAYAIIRYRVMEINLAFRYGTLYACLAVLVGFPFAVVTWLFSHSLAASALALISPVIGYFIINKYKPKITSIVDSLPPFRGRFVKISDLESNQMSISQARSVDEWAWRVVESVKDLFNVDKANVLLEDESLKSFHIKAGIGLNVGEMAFLELPYSSKIVEKLKIEKTTLIRDVLLESLNRKDFSEIEQELGFIHADICVPMFMRKRLIAVLNVGAKKDAQIFNDLDMAAIWGLARAAEETLRAILVGMEMKQYTQDWIHDLLHPFGAKGSLKLIREAIQGHFGNISEELKTALMLVWNDGQFIGKHLTKIIHPVGHDVGEMFNFERQPITKVYARLREKYMVTALEEGIRFVVNQPPESIEVECDWEMIEYRVITNLIENAFRYTPKGGIIELGYEVDTNEFVGFVRDTGIGIPKEKQSKIFERGVQGEETNRGTAGLGLSNVVTVISTHHGRVWVESDVGKGSTFFFSLPLVRN